MQTQIPRSAPMPSIMPVRTNLLQRKCACGGTPGMEGECAECRASHLSMQRQATGLTQPSAVPPIVHEVLRSPGQQLDQTTRAFMEPRFGHDFSQVRVHTDTRAAESAAAVNALAYTVGKDVVFGAGRYAPGTAEGRRLMAHELTHTLQQTNANTQDVSKISDPQDTSEREASRMAEQVTQMTEPVQSVGEEHNGRLGMRSLERDTLGIASIQRQADEEGAQDGGTQENQNPEEEGVEVGDQLMMLPRWQTVSLSAEDANAQRDASLFASSSSTPPLLQRQADTSTCHKPTSMRAVISGKFEGGKTMDDYFPDLVGKGFWGKNDTAGTFDNGTRAGSSVQLIGEYPSPCAPGTGANFTLGQMATIKRARADGKKMMENGKPLEGQTLDDIKRSGRDQSKPPFRQEFSFAVSMADPISGIPYNTLKSYEWEVDLTTSLTGKDGSKSVNWGVTVEASGGKVTKNEVR
ncbi:MAG TPA: DUF4157 domain-containing protein [Chloroflexia bacterium]